MHVEGENLQPVEGLLRECYVNVKDKELCIVYYNARSLLPKFDELCTLCATHKPDMLCLVETWLCNDISDNEIMIPGYQLYRLDRNRHGGGVLMYALEEFSVSPICHIHNNLEFLPLSVKILNRYFCITIFIDPLPHPLIFLVHFFILF